jgi:hypothetical protein
MSHRSNEKVAPVLGRDQKCLDHLRVDEVAIELVQFI